MTVVTATAEHDGRHAGWVLTFKYRPEVVGIIKDAVPGTRRHWRLATRTWWIDDHDLAALTDALTADGHAIRIVGPS